MVYNQQILYKNQESEKASNDLSGYSQFTEPRQQLL